MQRDLDPASPLAGRTATEGGTRQAVRRVGRVDPHGGSPAPMLEALEAQQPALGTLVAVGAGVVGEAAVVVGVRGRTARLGDRHGRRARGAGGQVGGREVAGVGQGQSRSGAAGLLGGLDHRQQLGLVGGVLGDVRGGDQQPAAAGPGLVRAASFVAIAAVATVFARLLIAFGPRYRRPRPRRPRSPRRRCARRRRRARRSPR